MKHWYYNSKYTNISKYINSVIVSTANVVKLRRLLGPLTSLFEK